MANNRQNLHLLAEKHHVEVVPAYEQFGAGYAQQWTCTLNLRRPGDTSYTSVPGDMASSKDLAKESAAKAAMAVLWAWFSQR
ncbi:hypothetical protein PIIN_08034 [Serendipita indica DSM 11827]|uniref:DRBM domain-containing protein n=1 Tax=Serendipita indica (strain DSM 11827) TaxID=1109443 RepID=G4TRY7_SERID|nr:hypothetical protein PIIN_08034 [Serendipita indica DSM 11827]